MKKTDRTKSGFILGRERFAKIAAVEGIRPSAELSADFRAFDDRKLRAAERRKLLMQKYGEKT